MKKIIGIILCIMLFTVMGCEPPSVKSVNGSFKTTLTDKYWWTDKTYLIHLKDAFGEKYITKGNIDVDGLTALSRELICQGTANWIFIHTETPKDKEDVKIIVYQIDSSDGVYTTKTVFMLDKQKITNPGESDRGIVRENWQQFAYDGKDVKIVKENLEGNELRTFLVNKGYIKQ